MADGTFTTEIWYTNGETYNWPEQPAVKTNVGICLPGGGTRRAGRF